MVILQNWGTQWRIRPDYTEYIYPNYSKLLAHVLREEEINVYKRSDLLKQVELSAKRKNLRQIFKFDVHRAMHRNIFL